MKQIIKQQHNILTDKKVLRKGAEILFVDPDEDIRGKYGNDYQELLTIRKVKNKFNQSILKRNFLLSSSLLMNIKSSLSSLS